MPFPLLPLLIGAGLGAITNPDDKLRGALIGGTLGAFTGGLGASAASSGAGTTAASGGASAASAAASEGAKVAVSEGAKAAATTAATEGAKTLATEGAKTAVQEEAKKTLLQRFMSPDNDKSFKAAQFALSQGQPQQQAPIQAAPQQQRQFDPPPSIEERLARHGGNEPLFVPKSVFSEERERLEEEELLRKLQERWMA